VDGQEDDLNSRFQPGDFSRDGEAVHSRHVNIEHRDFGTELLNLFQRRLAVPGLGDNLQFAVGFDRLSQSLAHDGMVVGDHDPDFFFHLGASFKLSVTLNVAPCPGAE
jgi:hypothetical protein